MLIVLDDASDIDQLEPLLPGDAGCLLLVTSRAQLAALDGVTPVSLEPMSDEDSASLISRIVGEQQMARSPRDVEALVELCGHLPLALRIAATRLKNRPTWTTADLVQRLDIEEYRLDELALGDRRVATAIELSYQRLPSGHQRLFRHLALAVGKDVDAYSAAALGGVPLAAADRMLEDLLDARLLQETRPNRYALHGLVRCYALQVGRTTDGDAEQREAFGRLLDYYVYAAETAAGQSRQGRCGVSSSVPAPDGAPTFDGQADALRWLEREQESLLAAAVYVAEHGSDLHAACFPRAISTYLAIRGSCTAASG